MRASTMTSEKAMLKEITDREQTARVGLATPSVPITSVLIKRRKDPRTRYDLR